MYGQKPYISNTTYDGQKYLPYTVNDAPFQEAKRDVVKSVSKSKFLLQLISCKLQL